MKRALLAAIAVLLLALPALAQEKETADEVRELQQSIRELREEISRLHLLNSLEFTLEQAQELKILLDNLKLARELFNQQTLSHQKGLVDVLGEIRDALAAGAPEPPEELLARHDELRRKNAQAGKEFFKKVKAADEELNAALSERQRKIVKDYDADPLKGVKNGPEGNESRLGQVAKLLDRVRAMNDQQLEQAKEKLMGQFLGKLTKDRSVPRQHVQATRRKIDEIIRNARGMEELEYMLWREEYAKQLLELGSPPKRPARQADRKQKGPELSKAGTMLLDEGMISALKIRIEALKKAGKEKPAGPGSEEPGEN